MLIQHQTPAEILIFTLLHISYASTVKLRSYKLQQKYETGLIWVKMKINRFRNEKKKKVTLVYSSSKGTRNKRPYIYNKYVNVHTQICPSKSYSRQNVTIYTKEGKMKNRKHSWPKRNICYPLIASDNFFEHFFATTGTE